MRIGHIVTLVDPERFGGPTTVALQQARALEGVGHTVEILGGITVRGERPTVPSLDVNAYRVRQLVPYTGFSGLFSVDLLRALTHRSRQLDILHIHLGRDLITLAAAFAAQHYRIPYVLQSHGMITPDNRLSTRLVDWAFTVRALTHAQAIFFLTNEERTALKAICRDDSRLHYLRNGIAANTVVSTSVSPKASRPNVLFCARLHPRKRVLAFAEMAAELLRRGVEATFTVIGTDEGDLPALNRRMAQPDLRGRLEYEGSMPPTMALAKIRNAAVYVLPSVDEPFPMTVLEAMSVGTPIVITDSCHISLDLAKRNAALVTNGSPHELANAVERVLSSPPLGESLHHAGLAAVNDAYGMAAVATQLDVTYKAALASAGP